MKKNFFRFAAVLLMGAFIAISCEEKPGPDGPDGPDGPEVPETPTKPSVQVKIDGDFSDWDAITADVAGKDDYMAVVSENSAEAIPVIKTSSDTYNVYFYIEMYVDALPQNAICSEWGDSWNGTPEQGYKGDENNDKNFHHNPPLNVFFDPDGKEDTGFYTYANEDGEAAIPGLGCEMCAQQVCFYNYEIKKFCIAWNQTNIGPETLDGQPFDYNGTFFQDSDWNSDGAFPQWGWQNYDGTGRGDNIAPKPENIQSVVVGESMIKIEFAIEKSELVNLPDEATEYAWGICYRWSDWNQDIGPIRAKYSE